MTEVLHPLESDGDEYPGTTGGEYDDAYDDRSPGEKLLATWRGWGRTRRMFTASGLAVLVTSGLVGGRFLFKGEDDAVNAAAKEPGAGAGLVPGADLTQPAGDTDNGQASAWAWRGECTDVTVTRGVGSTFTFTPTIKLLSGAANPSFLYTIVKYSKDGQYAPELVAARGIAPVTANVLGMYGMVQVAAVYFPTAQPASAEAIPPELGPAFPDAVVVPCEGLYASPDNGSPTGFADVLGDPIPLGRAS